jgi:peptide/nickel transport system permease protein
LSTLILVEFLFAWPGVGRNLFAAIGEGQTNLVVGLVLVLGLTIQFINFLSNITYQLIDPRIVGRS